MPTTAIYNLPDIKQGATLEAQTFRVTGTLASSSTLASVEMDFRKNNAEGCIALRLRNGSGITITNAATWEFCIDEITELALDPDYYVFSILTIAANGKRKHYAEGGMVVKLPATRD